VGYHNKYLLSSLEFNIITGRALAKTKRFRGGQQGGKGEGTGAAAPCPPAGYAHGVEATVHSPIKDGVCCHISFCHDVTLDVRNVVLKQGLNNHITFGGR